MVEKKSSKKRDVICFDDFNILNKNGRIEIVEFDVFLETKVEKKGPHK